MDRDLRNPLRLWPGVLAAAVQITGILIAIVVPSAGVIGMIGGAVGALAIIVWWLLFSRARWYERLGGIAVMAAAVFAAKPLMDKSILGAGMGIMFPVFAVVFMCLGLVAGVVASRRIALPRLVTMAAAMLLACAFWALVRTDGIKGGGGPQFQWRWTPTAEERLLAQAADEPFDSAQGKPSASLSSAPAEASRESSAPKPADEKAVAPATTATIAKSEPARPPVPEPPAEWPGFRGRARDGLVHGVRISTDWSASPPVELWHRGIGPGWSSFAVRGDFLYTQEQRGNDEIVSCYKVSTGEPVWRHRDPVRFYESNGGAGPRGTPTLQDGRVYAFGATGILNVLDERTGAVIWSRSVADDTKTKVPMWGFSSSPLVTDDKVIVAAAGRLAAYDLVNGKLQWSGPVRGMSYSSPHRVTINGVEQILLLTAPGVISVSPADGKVLWEHAWEGGAIVQPAQTPDGDILINAISSTGGQGMRRLAVSAQSGGWTVQERWTSTGLKPYFNDFVLHNGYAFGFDGNILSCIDLADGARKWKGGRFGAGQMLLLPDQDLLLVVSEDGELALVSATPDQFKELGRFPGIEGKTWNHPVLVRDVLLVRNGEEMAAFRLPLADR
jgi:outer membrane protein assembly factor BamB